MPEPKAQVGGGTTEPVAPSPASVAEEEESEAPPPIPRVSRGGWLGVEYGSTGAKEPGVRLTGVIPRSPAAKAGLRPGDVVIQIDGQPVSRPSDLVRLLSVKSAGDRVGIVVQRGPDQRLLAAELIGRPDRDRIMRMAFVGAKAPAFAELKPVQGTVPETLGALRGKVVVLEFWATWCPVCPALVPDMNRWHSTYAAQGVAVVGVTVDPVLMASRTAAQLEMKYPVLSDETGKTTESYRATALPLVFVIDKTGTVRDMMIGYDSVKLPELEQLVGRLVDEG